MNQQTDIESAYGPAAASPNDRRLATGWLALGIGSLGLAGLFAVLLVLARTPGLHEIFPTEDFFRTALVVHVDQSILIWFLAFAGVLWSLGQGISGIPGYLRWAALATATAGCVLLGAAPFLGAADPLMNNYVPVLQHPIFFASLVIFGTGILLQTGAYLVGVRQAIPWSDPMTVGAATAAVAGIVAAASLYWTWWNLSAVWEGSAYYEYLFWGGGHALQFVYTQLMLVAWLWLARISGIKLACSERWLSALLVLGILPLLTVPIIHGLYAVDSAETRLAFIQLMQYGNGLAAVPIGILLVYALWRQPRLSGAVLTPPYRALIASVVLFAAGGLLGALISGVNTIIPAHYHGSIVGVTLAMMGLTYVLLPRLGFAAPQGRMAQLQPTVYAVGQLLHIGGLAVSGAMGIQRKTAGAAQGLEGLYAKTAMGVMGLGGLLSIIGGIMFVLVVLLAFRSYQKT